MAAPLAVPAKREWPGTGTGAKTDAYAPKILERHQKQIDIFVVPEDMKAYIDAEGGLCVFEKFEGQRLVFFQGSWPSNFQPAIFRDANNVTYVCTEQAFQALKALLVSRLAKKKGLDDISAASFELYKTIMKSTNALYQKLSAGQQFLSMDSEMIDTWSKVSSELMLQLNRLKYKQNKHLQARLIALGECKIFEAIPDDNLWAIGLNAHSAIFGPPADLDPSIRNYEKIKAWKGLNNMSKEEIDATEFLGKNRQGKILTHVLRELLQGFEEPLEGSTDEIREIVAELFKNTVVAEDEDSPEKKGFYSRLSCFEGEGPPFPKLPRKRSRSPT